MAKVKTYFEDHELMCKCGCGEVKIDPEALLRLNMLRLLVGMPLPLTSAYRCRKHPEEAKKAVPGQHNRGKAFDIKITSGRQRARILKYAGQCGFTAFGLAKSFIHLDCRGDDASWTYS